MNLDSLSLNNAVRLYEAGKTDEAEVICRQILQAQPANADALQLLAGVCLRRKNYEEAETAILQAIALNKRAAEYRNDLGNIYKAQDKLDLAEKCFRKALKLKPRYADPFANLGALRAMQGKPQEAADAYQKALELDPDRPEILQNFGRIMTGTAKPEQAIEYYNKALLLKPDSPEILTGMAEAYKNQRKFGEAVAGIAHSAACQLQVTLHGKASHGARPHQGINVAETAGLITHAVGLVHCDPRVTHSAKPTRILIDTGTFNIIPDKAIMNFDLRSQTNEVMDMQRERVTRAIVKCAEAMGASAEIEVVGDCPAASLDPAMVAEAAAAITAVLGKSLDVVEVPASEDFHCFAVEGGMRTTLIGIGTDVETHHNSKVIYNLGAMPIGVKIMTTFVRNKLG